MAPSPTKRLKNIQALHRKAYSCEVKLIAISEFRKQEQLAATKSLDKDGKVQKPPSKYSIGKKYGITATMLRKWLENEKTIRNMTVGQMKDLGIRKAKYPLMETKLTDVFIAIRAEGYKVKRRWFLAEARKIFVELYPEEVTESPTGDGTKLYAFKFSRGWFRRYKKRNRISYRASTHVAQRIPASFIEAIQRFHEYIRYNSSLTLDDPPYPNAIVGNYRLCDIANMDQTPLEFDFLSGRTYHTTGDKTVWVKGTGSGLEKRQATVQLCVFADGIPRVKPLLVFRGQGKGIAAAERGLWDNRVHVQFQPNAWVDEAVMLKWIEETWKTAWSSIFDRSKKMLVLDCHRSQKTDLVKEAFKRRNTLMAIIPAGCTSLVQPLDVVVNKPFKVYVELAADAHYEQHTTDWIKGHFTASQRRVLMTKWVGEAWEQIGREKKAMVVRSFAKCGISLPIDGSRDTEINIEGIAEYSVFDDSITRERRIFIRENGNGDFDSDSELDLSDELVESDDSDNSDLGGDTEELHSGEYVMDFELD